MGIILVLLVAIPLIVALCCAAASDEPQWDNRAANAVIGFICTAAVTGLLAGMIVLCIGLAAVSNINGMKAFVNQNLAQYDQSIVLIRQGIVVDANGGYILDAANVQQITAYSDAVKARQKAIVDYNNKLNSQLYWEGHWLTGWFWPNAPPELQFIS